MPIAEPTTTLTDYVLGIEALWLGGRLWRLGAEPGRSATRWLGAALVATGLGALTGGSVHGFAPWIAGTVLHTILWKTTLLCIGLTSMLFLWSVAAAALTGTARRWLEGLAVVELLVYAAWISRHDEFVWAILDYVPAMVIALLAFAAQAARGSAPARWLVAGILSTFAGAAVQASGFALHRHFNHNDLFHVIQMVAVYWIYRGGCDLDPEVASAGG